MSSSPFFNFLMLTLYKERARHLSIIIISIVIIFILSSTLFISSSIESSLKDTLKSQPDFVVSKIQGGSLISTPISWMDEILDIYGISDVTPRIYGRYFFKEKESSALIVGVDFLEEQGDRNLKTVIDHIDIKEFLSSKNMIVGRGVKQYLKEHFYTKNYRFLTPKGNFESIHIYDTLPTNTNLVANDMMIMPIDLARKILGYHQEEVSDIVFNVPNPDEWDMINDKVSSLHFNLISINKSEVAKSYKNLFNYKGGLFLIIYLVVIMTFCLILYQRYSMINSSQKRHIGLLRALGWSINDVLKFKSMETIVIVISSYILGIFFAYIFVFVFDAPLLSNIFLGSQNLSNKIAFTPYIDISLLSSIFFIYAIPFLASVIIPVWKIAVTDPKEAML